MTFFNTMVFTTYVLFSENYGKHYVGFTSNLIERMRSHNELGDDWTKSYRPWKMIYYKAFYTKKEAMEYEKWLKSGVGREFIKTVPH